MLLEVSHRTLLAAVPLRSSSRPVPVIGCCSLPYRCEAARVLWRSSDVARCLELHGDAADAVVLAERVPLPVLGHEDAGEIGMAVEPDAEEIERLALVGL